jgi:cytosine deaminase
MTDHLNNGDPAGVSRRGFFGRLAAAGVTAAGALQAAGCEDRESANAGSRGEAQTASGQPMAMRNVDGVEKVRLRGKPGFWNVAIRDGRITQISEAPVSGGNVIAGEGKLLTEGLVEHHIHLDKTLTSDRLRWDEAGLKADHEKHEAALKAGTFFRGFTFYRESMIKATFTEEDVAERAVRLARMQSACGATAIRSHAVVETVRGLNCVKGLVKAREIMRPFMDLQISLHPQDEHLLKTPKTVELMREAMKSGADGVGGLPELDWDRADEFIELVFRLAKDTGGFIDMHVDQGGAARENKKMFSHPIIVAKTRKYGMQGKVTASHSYSLAYQPREKVLPVLDEMAELGIHLSCSPESFGEERVRIPRSRGVNVSLHNDNVRDPLNPGGKADLIEQASKYRAQMRLNTDEEIDQVFDLITTCPGKSLGLEDYGLREGGAADLVLWEAESAPQVVLHQAKPLYVLKNGKVVVQAGRALT